VKGAAEIGREDDRTVESPAQNALVRLHQGAHHGPSIPEGWLDVRRPA
jgi:hypothetical protein